MPQWVDDFNPLLIFICAIRVKSGTGTLRLQFLATHHRQRIEVNSSSLMRCRSQVDRVRDHEVLLEEGAVENEAASPTNRAQGVFAAEPAAIRWRA